MTEQAHYMLGINLASTQMRGSAQDAHKAAMQHKQQLKDVRQIVHRAVDLAVKAIRFSQCEAQKPWPSHFL